MPDNSQADDIYTSRQLSLSFGEAQNENTIETEIEKVETEIEAKVEAVIETVTKIATEAVEKIEEKTNQPRPDRYLFVDLETGGLYADKHAVLQVAAVITDLDFNIQGYFMSYIQPHPELEVNPEALAINRLSLDILKSAPPEKSVAHALRHFANLLSDTPRFAGYNCQFDLEFLASIWSRHDLLPAPYQVPWLDIYTVAKARLGVEAGLPNFKLASVAAHFAINAAGAHDAVEDLVMTIEIAKRLKAMDEKLSASKNGINLETAKFSF